MKEILLDIVKHVNNVDGLTFARIKGSEQGTTIETAKLPTKNVILLGDFNKHIPEFDGEFGLGNIDFLNNILNLPDYDEECNISVINDKEDDLKGLTIENSSGSVDKYSFISKKLLDQMLPVISFKGAKWDITFEPTKLAVSHLSAFANAYSNNEKIFSVYTEKNNLVFKCGSLDSNGGTRIFAKDVGYSMKQSWSWQISPILQVLKLGLSGHCVCSLSDQGVFMISVDSGVCTYKYYFPADHV